MIPPHLSHHIYFFFFQQNYCTPPKCGELSEYTECMNVSDMTDASTTQDNFILPVPPVGGLPISQNWLDRKKLVRDRTIPITLSSGKNTLADTVRHILVECNH